MNVFAANERLQTDSVQDLHSHFQPIMAQTIFLINSIMLHYLLVGYKKQHLQQPTAGVIELLFKAVDQKIIW